MYVLCPLVTSIPSYAVVVPSSQSAQYPVGVTVGVLLFRLAQYSQSDPLYSCRARSQSSSAGPRRCLMGAIIRGRTAGRSPEKAPRRSVGRVVPRGTRVRMTRGRVLAS